MWIARDKYNELWIFEIKPFKSSNIWVSVYGKVFNISSKLFPEVRWEDKEPRELILKPIE